MNIYTPLFTLSIKNRDNSD